jgi:hypothetical protein
MTSFLQISRLAVIDIIATNSFHATTTKTQHFQVREDFKQTFREIMHNNCTTEHQAFDIVVRFPSLMNSNEGFDCCVLLGDRV